MPTKGAWRRATRMMSASRPQRSGERRQMRQEPRRERTTREPAGCARLPSMRAMMMKAALPPERVEDAVGCSQMGDVRSVVWLDRVIEEFT